LRKDNFKNKMNMKQKIILQCGRLHFISKNVTVIAALIIVTFFMQPSLFAQMKLNTTGKNGNAKDALKGITIHQEINFKATPQRLYETLLSSKEFSDCTKRSFGDFSARSANIDAVAGGAFTVFDGHIIGRILELVPYQRIVEAWRVVDWPAGLYSIATFEFKLQDAGTKLIFDHIGFPEGMKEHLSIGWQQHYWDALSKYLQ
jgi:activator of HSP90 ATPase